VPSVFVSFRNGDAPFAAAMVYRTMVDRFGAGQVFWSGQSIPPGAPWAEAIWENHRASTVLIAVIGPHWLSIVDKEQRPRLWTPGDWVHDEIAVALRESKVVIPVLLAGVPRLVPDDLPPDLVRLAELQSVVMDHRRVDAAIDEIAERVAGMLAPAYCPEFHFRNAPPAIGRISTGDPRSGPPENASWQSGDPVRPGPHAPRGGSPFLVNNRRGRRG
jgi:hypothetical protein